jgi:tetratricopeptide (TPR) repeat protein
MKTFFSLSAMSLLFALAFPVALAAQEASELIEEGNRNWSGNRLEEAETAYRKAIDSDPESSVAYSRLGALLVIQNRSEEAVSAYQEAIIREPGNANYFAALSIAYLHMGYHEMARAMATHAAELDPDMKHAKDISKYIDAKLERMAEAAAQEAHGSAELDAVHQNEANKHHP